AVSGKREEAKEESGETYYACERSYGSFTRSFTLPEGSNPEHIHADLKAGVLTIGVPKNPETKTKKVEIKAEKAAKA
ncbi:MAG: Hsp20/alpha crystallin family protein, partial [Myxococcaceae bacterium]